MAHIDALVDKVADPALRAALREQVDTLLHKRSFGLVFQEHRPETVELPQHRVRRGCKVRVRNDTDQALYRVDQLRGESATVTSLTEPPVRRELRMPDVVVVREFGDPLYPGLVSTGRVHLGGDKPAHVVINAENFHALETLLYTHEGKVDAIYIDPPYNTRDKDWKYNNDYVDSDDVYRHSKWLAMMQRRLDLARQLLNPADSVLLVTIDQNKVHRLGLGWHLLSEQVLDQLDVEALAADATRRGFGSTLLPAEVAAVLSTRDRLASTSNPVRRRAIRRTGMAWISGHGNTPDESASWSVVWVQLRLRSVHVVLTGHTGPVIALAAVPLPDGRTPARHRQLGQHGAAVEPRHRHPGRPPAHRPHRLGDRGGGGAAARRTHPARHRQLGSDGAVVGPSHRRPRR